MTESSFEEIWQSIVTRLKTGMSIRNWTVLKGYLGDTMKVAQVNQDEIVIQSPKAKNLLHVSRDEFEKIFEVWPAYKVGRMQRQEVVEMTFYSKYIISILHWMEQN